MSTRRDYEPTFKALVGLLFHAVGEVAPKPEGYKDLPDGWYDRHTWTEDQVNAFREKAIGLVMRRHKSGRTEARREVDSFLLRYGWPVQLEGGACS